MMKRFFLWLLFIPVQLFLLILFFIIEGLRIPVIPFYSHRFKASAKAPRSCSIVVLNWNGRHLLQESLPPILKAVQSSSARHQVIVVDNGSEDDSVAWLKSNYPEIDLLELDQNHGFGEGNNLGVKAARFDHVILLNNDMIVDDDFITPLLEPFSDPTVFAVTSQVFFPEGKRREETGHTTVRFKFGYPHFSHDPVRNYHNKRKSLPVLWAGGGSSAFRKDIFLKLGGFNPLFSPCYFEDTDLSYRAWRRGYKILYAPQSRVLHKHRSSSKTRFQEAQLNSLIEERKLWYLWRNFQLRSLFSHFLLFPWNLTKWLPVFTYLKALRKIPQILATRLLEPRRLYSDLQLFSWINRPITYLNHFHPDRAETNRNPDSPLRILLVSAYLPHLGTHGGAGRVFQLMKRAAQKHQVDLVTFIESDRDLSFTDQAKECCRQVKTVFRRQFKPLSFFPYEPFEEFNSLEFRQTLEEVLSEEDYDLVHYEWTQMAMFADLFPRIPQLVTEIEVNYAAHQTLIPVEKNFLKKIKLYYNSLQTLYREIELCRKTDRVICVTSEDRDYLRGYLPDDRLCVINTGVDPDYFQYENEPFEKNAIVFVGAFRHHPNIDAMLYFKNEIFPLILKEVPETRLYVVGSSPTPEIQALAEQPSVTVTGFVEDIRDYYRLAQVVVVPLRTGVGIRGKILEGWSAGRAMVATSLACQGISAVHGQNIMIADEPDLFARWTVALLKHPEFCHGLGKKGRQLIEEKYDWDVLGEQMIDLYEEVAGVPRSSAR